MPVQTIKLEERIRQMAYQGADFETLVKEIEKKAPDPETAGFVRKKLDEFLVAYQLGLEAKNKSLNTVFQGIVILVIGIGFFAYAQNNVPTSLFLKYGVILAGAWRAWSGYKIWNRPVAEFIPQKPAKFKRKSPLS